MSLQSLEQFNAAQTERWKRLRTPAPNGIACPQCGAECVEVPLARVVMSDPPLFPMNCSACAWTGHRVSA